jgi:hypothetical protein
MSIACREAEQLYARPVHYHRWLIAKGNYFSPSSAAIVKLIERLRAEQWIIAPKAPDMTKLRFVGPRQERARSTGGYVAQTVETPAGADDLGRMTANIATQPAAITAAWLDAPDREELRLVWPASGEDPLPVKYPLSQKPASPVSFALELHRAHDYVYPASATIGAIPTMCRCGEDLAFGWDEDELVPAFEGSSGIYAECEACSRTFDPSQGTAVVTNPFDGTRHEVRGGAAYRFALKVDCGDRFVADAGLAFARELVAVVEDEFGREFYEVGSKY